MSIWQDTRYIGRRTKSGNGLMIRALKCGEKVGEWFVPCNEDTITGDPKELRDGKFIPMTDDAEIEAIRFFARRGLNQGQ